jgi:hypothetical protein
MAYRQIAAPQGMGCAGLGCPAGGAGCGCAGMGLFDSGTDFTEWGWPEWGIVIVGGYMVLSTLFTTRRAVGRVKAFPSNVRAGVKRGRKRLAKRIAGD